MPRPALIEDLAYEMFLQSGRFQGNVRDWESRLYRIFSDAEKKLFAERGRILSRVPTGGPTPSAIARIDKLADQVRQGVQSDLVEPGRDWADDAILGAFRDGKALARTNMSFDLIDRETVRQAFKSVRAAERGVLEVGVRDTYRIMDTVGDDVADFFRDTMTDAAIRGIPIQGRGDTLENAIFEGGRLRPQTIRTADGRLIRRSMRQRAVAVARVETAKVYNRVHELKTKEVLGEEAVYANANPEDTRTTKPCMEASGQEPMTLEEWDKSAWGRPPRLRPQFHL